MFDVRKHWPSLFSDSLLNVVCPLEVFINRNTYISGIFRLLLNNGKSCIPGQQTVGTNTLYSHNLYENKFKLECDLKIYNVVG